MLAIVDGPIDVGAVRAAASDPSFGAILVFEGVGRHDFEGRRVVQLAYEAYAEMAVPVLESIAAEATARWPGCRVAMVHRTGIVAIGEPSVVIAVGTPHRAECYEISRYALEALKARLPVWKKEVYEDGSAWKANTPDPTAP
ncbi:MAG TPA: molybdenum cofactor biosynthesis protein MoaE [Deltaproteobacteria bacterium]|nr:molybdenum cofactor biosynthesis protein MoaE [Deltaproteobacteria bacterium]